MTHQYTASEKEYVIKMNSYKEINQRQLQKRNKAALALKAANKSGRLSKIVMIERKNTISDQIDEIE